MNVSDLILVLFASFSIFRLAELVAKDKGPFNFFKWLRNLYPKKSLVDQMLECPYCNSGWFSLIFATGVAIWYRPLNPFEFFLFWTAPWGGGMAIYRSVRVR